MVKILWAKGAKNNKDSLNNSFSWTLHKRGFLVITSQEIDGYWKIKYDDIDEAVIFSSWHSIIPSYVIRIRSKGQAYQFIIWKPLFKDKYLQFPIKRLKNPLIHTIIAWIIRAAVLAAIIYFFYPSIFCVD